MTDEQPQQPRWRRIARYVGLALGAVALLTSPWWGRASLQRMDFFRVRRVEIEGTRYVSPDQIVSRLSVDTTASVWDDLSALEVRVRQHPSVREVRVSRRLPGTIVVRVTENLPVALVQATAGLVPVDAAGRSLPIDPTSTDVDLPVLATRDTAALRVLGELRNVAPALFGRIGEVRRITGGDLLFKLADQPAPDILAAASVTAERLAEIVPVEQDLARRNRRATELDLRFREQVIARLP